jgi:molybdopterin molybdotransferase
VQLPIAPDEASKLVTLIEAGLAADMLLLSGGVSMGKFDLVEQELRSLGAEFLFTGVLIQPGRPVVFGEVKTRPEVKASEGANNFRATDPAVTVFEKKTPFFGLPGNPISAMVTFDLFARPVLQALSGAVPVRLPTAKARLRKDFKANTGLTRFIPAILEGGLSDPEVEAIAWQGSGDVLASARANCYLVVPPDRALLAAGEMVSVVLR